MRKIGTVSAALGAFALGVAPTLALGDDSPVPGLPSVSVPTVTVEVPTVTVPGGPTVSVPGTGGGGSGGGSGGGGSGGGGAVGGAVSTVTSAVSSLTSGGSGSSGGSGTSGGSSSATSSGGSGTAGSSSGRSARRGSGAGPRVSRARAWPKRLKNRGDDHRGTRLVFRLDRRTPVRFTVFRVWPDCSRAGSFVRLGHRGRNAVRFSGRLRGHALAPGTYRIAIRPLRGARPGNVRRVTVVIVPPRQAVRTARAHRSVCGPPRGAEAQPGFAAAGGRGSGAVLASEHSGSSASEASSSGTAGGDDASGGSASQEAVAPPRGGGSSPDSAGPALGIFFVSVLAALLGLLAWGGWRTATGRGS